MKTRPIAPLRGCAFVAAFLPGMFAAVLSARADVITSYNGDRCRVMTNVDEAYVDTAGGVMAVKPSAIVNSVTVMCPITKFTSGPSISNDQIFQVSVSQNSVVAGDVQCTLRSYSSFYDDAFGDPTNVEDSEPDSGRKPSTVSGTSNISFPSGLPQTNYWSISSIWSYAMIICDIKRGARINSYSVGERGSNQPNHRIFSAASCKPPAGSNYESFAGDLNQRGGYWDGNFGTFALNCEIPSDAARGVQASVSPSTNATKPLRYSMDGSNWTTVAQNPANDDLPTVLVRHTYGSGVQTLRFDQPGSPDQGDPKIFTYRTMPLAALPRGGWGTFASHRTENAFRATDGNGGTRWTTETAQVSSPEQWFQVDMIGSQQFLRLVLDSTGSTNDYPKTYRVHASNDSATLGNIANSIASGTGSGNVITITLPPTTARYIRVYQTGAKSNWWSIHEFNVFSVGGP